MQDTQRGGVYKSDRENGARLKLQHVDEASKDLILESKHIILYLCICVYTQRHIKVGQPSIFLLLAEDIIQLFHFFSSLKKEKCDKTEALEVTQS